MQWRFWRRSGRKDVDETAPEEPRTNADGTTWPANACAKEILGLQQLIGNQAVLRMLNRNEHRVESPFPGSKESDTGFRIAGWKRLNRS